MKRKTIVLTGSLIGALILLGALRQAVGNRNEVVSLPMDAAETAFNHLMSAREEEAAAQAEADREFIEQSQLLQAHEVIRIGLSEWQGLRDPETCIRAKTMEGKFIKWRDATGQSMEMILHQEFAAHLQRVDEWHKTNPGISGDAEAIAKSRAVRGDTEALLYLADIIYSGSSVPVCQDSYAKEVARLTQVFTEVAARVETTEQQMARLRAEQVAKAKEVWDRTGTAEPELQPPVVPSPDAPATETPAPEVEAQDNPQTRTALGKLFYGEE